MSVFGAPGIGKSRLVHEFAAGLDERATVLRGRCLPYGDGITFWPLAEMVKQAAAISESDGPEEAVAKLEALLAPADDARTTAEAIAQLTGLMETRGVVGEGSGACEAVREPGGSPAGRCRSGRRPVGRGNASLADRERGTSYGPFRSSCSAPAAQTSSSGVRTGARPPAEAEARR